MEKLQHVQAPKVWPHGFTNVYDHVCVSVSSCLNFIALGQAFVALVHDSAIWAPAVGLPIRTECVFEVLLVSWLDFTTHVPQGGFQFFELFAGKQALTTVMLHP